MSQKEYAAFVGCSFLLLNSLECMRYPDKIGVKLYKSIKDISDDCGCSTEDIAPSEMLGKSVPKFISVEEVSPDMIIQCAINYAPKMIESDQIIKARKIIEAALEKFLPNEQQISAVRSVYLESRSIKSAASRRGVCAADISSLLRSAIDRLSRPDAVKWITNRLKSDGVNPEFVQFASSGFDNDLFYDEDCGLVIEEQFASGKGTKCH